MRISDWSSDVCSSDLTSAHCGRVGRLALALAEDLGLAGEALLVLDVAARFHDVGKIGVPDAILHKQGALNDAEWEIMKGHSLHGEHIVGMDQEPPFGDAQTGRGERREGGVKDG